jgi:hypothetical protein
MLKRILKSAIEVSIRRNHGSRAVLNRAEFLNQAAHSASRAMQRPTKRFRSSIALPTPAPIGETSAVRGDATAVNQTPAVLDLIRAQFSDPQRRSTPSRDNPKLNVREHHPAQPSPSVPPLSAISPSALQPGHPFSPPALCSDLPNASGPHACTDLRNEHGARGRISRQPNARSPRLDSGPVFRPTTTFHTPSRGNPKLNVHKHHPAQPSPSVPPPSALQPLSLQPLSLQPFSPSALQPFSLQPFSPSAFSLQPSALQPFSPSAPQPSALPPSALQPALPFPPPARRGCTRANRHSPQPRSALPVQRARPRVRPPTPSFHRRTDIRRCK